ncbi:MAG: murein hydrolase activator EnvC family protein [Legionella sp.]
MKLHIKSQTIINSLTRPSKRNDRIASTTSTKIIPTLLLLVWVTTIHATSSSVQDANNQLQALEKKIKTIQRSLVNSQQRQGLLNNELTHTERKISDSNRQINTAKTKLLDNKQEILSLERQIIELKQQLQAQEKKLVKQIQILYKIRSYQPLQTLLSKNNPYTVERLLSFYYYILKSRQSTIIKIRRTNHDLINHQKKLSIDIKAQQRLVDQLTHQQQKLHDEKIYHRTLINALGEQMRSQQQQLTNFQQNRASLSKILHSLLRQSRLETKGSFAQMRHKLPRPIRLQKVNYAKMNQGVTFFAEENTPVIAVYSGKVVFSEWLKGYGLLLIIDHGDGFMTLYAHNQSLLKQKGAKVTGGEPIASVGHSGTIKQNGLYFEVRQHGKAISPLQWIS